MTHPARASAMPSDAELMAAGARRVERIGDAVLVLGDALALMPTLPFGTFDCLLTDPPYSSGARRDAERQVRGSMLRSMDDADWFSHDAMTSWGFSWFARSVFGGARGALCDGAHVYVFIDWRQTPNVYGMLEASGYRVNHCLVWDKGHFGMGAYWRNQHENIVFASNGGPCEMADHGMGSVLRFSGVSPAAREHPTEKPVALLREIIRASGRQSVLDPFMGAGSAGVAAIAEGRPFLGVEINPAHFATACRRVAEAARQPSLFDAAPPPKPVQATLDYPTEQMR
jgi:site-specific DNA-methyltransferase (adenine-specific)